MKKAITFSILTAALLAGTIAQPRPGDRWRDRMAQRQTSSDAPQAEGKQTMSYWPDRLQALDFYPAASGGKGAPMAK